MKRKSYLVTIMGVVLALVFTACAPAAPPPAAKETAKPAAKEPYKIAFVGSKTGTFGALGSSLFRGVELEVERINQRGGVDGHPLQVVSYDDQSKSEETIALLRKAALDDKALAIIGPLPAVLVVPALPVLRELKVPAFPIGQVDLTPEDRYVFTLIASVPDYLNYYFDYASKKGWKKMVGLNTRDDLAERIVKYMDANAGKFGVQILSQERIGQTDTDVTPQLTKLKALNPDVLLTWSAGDPTVLSYKNARQIGFDAPMMISTSAGVGRFFQLTGDIPREGLLYMVGTKLDSADVLPDSPTKKELLEFRSAFKTKYDMNAAFSEGVAKDAVDMLAEALKAAGPDREKIRGNLENIKFEGTQSYKKSPQDHMGIDTAASWSMLTAKGSAWIPAK